MRHFLAIALLFSFSHPGVAQTCDGVFNTPDGGAIQQFNKILSRNPDALRTRTAPIDFKKDADLIVFVPEEVVPKLGGGVLNQHQVGKSGGSFSPAARKAQEDALLGMDVGYDDAAKALRPKSAYLNIRNDQDYGYYTDDLINHYGGVGVMLKPSLMDRSIWVAGDSYDLLGRLANQGEKEIAKHFGTFSEKAIATSEGFYLEALVYGKVSMQDIDCLLVLNEDIGRRLPDMGIPIYYMEIKRDKGRFIFSKGKRLK